MKIFESKSMAEVAYANLNNSFNVMMKQYKDLESLIADRDLEIIKLKQILGFQREELFNLGKAKQDLET